MNSGLKRLFAFALPAAFLLLAVHAQVPGVAIVTDLSGKASVHAGAGLTILSEIAAEARVDLAPGARLTALYFQSGDEYTFAGPAQIQFGPKAPSVLSGPPPLRRASPLERAGRGVAIRPLGVTQAAFVLRSARPTARLRLLTLAGTRTLETSPEFRWQEIEPGLLYRFELMDETGKSLFETNVRGGVFRLPSEIRLREGVSYTWEVSARTADGGRYSSAGDFSLALAEVRSQVELLRPAPGAPVSERVAFAVWLEQMELKDEARKYWRALAAERPDDLRLKSLAAE